MIETDSAPENSPVLNVPGIVVVCIALLVAIHMLLQWYLPLQTAREFLFEYAFIPARYAHEEIAALSRNSLYWSPVTYSLLHGDWTHLIMNALWMLVFGGVVAKRIGNLRFVLLFVAGALAGAAAHYLAYPNELVPMIGASASVSAFIGAAIRFAFPSGRLFSMNVEHLPAQPLARVFANPQAMTFLAVWFVINLLFGVGAPALMAASPAIAWQAHIGGCLAGIFLFPLFDRSR